MSPDQLVGANLRRAREAKGWTQSKAAAECAPYLGGETWSVARWSQAERSAAGERVRPFSASELVAFATVFDRPLIWFLLPVTEDADDLETIDDMSVGDEVIDLSHYLDLIWPHIDITRTADDDPSVGVLEKRLASLSILAGFDLKERIQASLEPLAAHGVRVAAPEALELVRTLEALQAFIEAKRNTIAQVLVEPMWNKALEEAMGEGEE